VKEIVCIVCPRGCKLSVDPDHGYAVSGAFCKRGEAYGRAEAENPVRVLTSSVSIDGALYPRCPVKSAAPIPKRLLFAAMDELRKLRLASPVKAGEVVTEDICGTGIPVVATRTMDLFNNLFY
jgi:CxxC motif-containing protein